MVTIALSGLLLWMQWTLVGECCQVLDCFLHLWWQYSSLLPMLPAPVETTVDEHRSPFNLGQKTNKKIRAQSWLQLQERGAWGESTWNNIEGWGHIKAGPRRGTDDAVENLSDCLELKMPPIHDQHG